MPFIDDNRNNEPEASNTDDICYLFVDQLSFIFLMCQFSNVRHIIFEKDYY